MHFSSTLFFHLRTNYLRILWHDFLIIFSPNDRYLRDCELSGPLFPFPQGTLPWQSILWQNLGICSRVSFENGLQYRHSDIKKNIQWQYISYILCKYDENRSSNPRDYEGNKCTFMDETAKIGLSHQISHQTARPIFTNASALVMYV